MKQTNDFEHRISKLMKRRSPRNISPQQSRRRVDNCKGERNPSLCTQAGNKALLFGNGGSAADAQI